MLPQLMDSSSYPNGEFSCGIYQFVISNQTEDINIVSSNDPTILNISPSSKQTDIYPFVEATENRFLSQEQSMMRIQLKNKYHASSSKKDIQYDFSSGKIFRLIYHLWYMEITYLQRGMRIKN